MWLNKINMPVGSDWLEIFVLAVLIFIILKFFKGTRGSSIFTGLIIFFVTLYILTTIINLDVLNWILSKLTLYFSLAMIIIFQPEIRRALARLGRQPWKGADSSSQKSLISALLKAANTLSEKKIGALIAVEREIGTRTIQDTGILLNASVTHELLVSIFFPRSPLHDGGVIISGNCIKSAGCLFPLSQKDQINKSIGTRHRAALGITEETDSVVLVVSEQTGAISIAYNGKLRRGLSSDKCERILTSILRNKKTQRSKMNTKDNQEKLLMLNKDEEGE